MKRFLFSILLCLICAFCNAQGVKYGLDPFWEYVIHGSDSNLVLTIKCTTEFSTRIADEPKILIRFFNDSTILLSGTSHHASKETYGAVGIPVGSTIINSALTYNVTYADFHLTKEQFLFFYYGIKKVRLNTTPTFYEKEWGHDRIGNKLFMQYVNNRKNNNSFEDGF